MYPHQNNMRERRGGQPPMAPQHLMGMPQQGPGVIMSMPNQTPVQIMQNHYSNQNSYSQSNVSASYVPQQQQHQTSTYHQSYTPNNPQVVLTKQTVNRNKNYRKEYNVVKEPVSFNEHKQQNFGNSEYNTNSAYNTYNQNIYNGQQNQSQHQDVISKNSGKHVDLSSKEQDDNSKSENKQNSENSQECPAVPHVSLPNAKEKTPMCLVNELARFNKITHQYRLTDEQGPAHKKSFTVTLTLGTEEYTAEGPSIKKAQHSAAAEALSKTSFPHPTPKTNKNVHSGKSNITPTVELNALAMKRGEPAIYKLLEPPHGQQVFPSQQAYSFRRPYGIRGGLNKRGRENFVSRGGRFPVKPTYSQNLHYTVSLKVGSYEFFGEGNSPQSARHDAASKALSQLKMLPVPENETSNKKDAVSCPANVEQEFDSVIKSPISLVHEIALKRNMNVTFQVVSEKGPPHMKIFVTKCTVGDVSATGEGNGKKLSKKRAAENMLLELKKLPPLSPPLTTACMNLSRMKRKPPQTKKKARNLIKIVQEHKSEPEYGEDVNPISRLIQIQQVKKEKEPVYTLLEEKGMPRRREFVMEVAVGSMKATGSGPNKKVAKKAAAQNLLTAMGYGKPDATPSSNPTKPALKTQDGSQDMSKDRKVTFVDSDKPENNTGGSVGRQVKPGIYVMSGDSSSKTTMNMPINLQTTATIAKELLKGGNSPTADALIQNSAVTKSTSQPVTHVFRPKEQLLYLADLLKFQVQFSDFPKGNHSEYLSLVTMSTDPSHVCHGSGPSIDESQDQAALTALRALAEMGLDSVTTPAPTKEIKKGGKGMGSMKK